MAILKDNSTAGGSIILTVDDVDDTPVDAATTAPVSSNWAYDHINAANPHSIYARRTEVETITGIWTFDNGFKTDTISEETAANGVVIDSVKLQDARVVLPPVGGIWCSDAGLDSLTELKIDFPNVQLNGAHLSLFRNTNTSGDRDFTIYAGDGTATTKVILDAVNASTFGVGIKTDSIDEVTAGGGVTIDGVAIKDFDIYDGLASGNVIGFPSDLKTDTIFEYSTGVGVTIDSVHLKDSSIGVGGATAGSLDIVMGSTHDAGLDHTVNGIEISYGASSAALIVSGTDIRTDAINEITAGLGVAIDGLTVIKDGGITNSDASPIAMGAYGITLDTIDEFTAAAGITIDGMLIKDSVATLGSSTATTQTTGDSSTKVATTAFVNAEIIDDALIQGSRTRYITAKEFGIWTTGDPDLFELKVTTNANVYNVLRFNPTTARGITYSFVLPRNWDKGTIVAKCYWSHPTTTTNFGVVWEVRIGSANDGETLGTDVSTTGKAIADTGGSTEYLYITDSTAAITVRDSPADEAIVQVKVIRQTGYAQDTMAVDAHFHGILLTYTEDAGDES